MFNNMVPNAPWMNVVYNWYKFYLREGGLVINYVQRNRGWGGVVKMNKGAGIVKKSRMLGKQTFLNVWQICWASERLDCISSQSSTQTWVLSKSVPYVFDVSPLCIWIFSHGPPDTFLAAILIQLFSWALNHFKRILPLIFPGGTKVEYWLEMG